MPDYSKYAIGRLVYDNTWAAINKNFHFVVAWGGKSYNKPNENLKSIEEKAAELDIPVIGLWDFDIDEYIQRGLGMDRAKWVPAEDDAQLQMFKRAWINRNVKGVIVRLMNRWSVTANKEQAGNYYSFAAEIFCERASAWLESAKKTSLYIGTSDPWIKANSAPDLMDNWVHKYFSAVVQSVTMQRGSSYPPSDAKPGHLSKRGTWELWSYLQTTKPVAGQPPVITNELWLANGTPERLYTEIGFVKSGTTPPPPPPPPLPPDDDDNPPPPVVLPKDWEITLDSDPAKTRLLYNGVEVKATRVSLDYRSGEPGKMIIEVLLNRVNLKVHEKDKDI